MSFHGYNILWIMVFFDLPVGSKIERKEATSFRNNLLNFGFEMSQYSVYMKWCIGYERARTIISHVRIALPRYGNISIINITDKQFQKMYNFKNQEQDDVENMQKQYELFD